MVFPLFAMFGAQNVSIEVVDSVSREGIPYVAVYVEGTRQGIMTDEQGRALITLNQQPAVLEFSSMGYSKKRVPVGAGMEMMRVALSPTGYALDEVVVKKKREHYSKRNNPAVAFMEKIRQGGERNDPRNHDNFSYTRYERIAFGLNDMDFGSDSIDQKTGKPKKKGKFDFIREHVDTSEITGKPILPLSVKEKVSDVIYRRDPQAEKTYVRGQRRSGVDDMGDMENMQTLFEDSFREIDLFGNDVNILQNRFVSPLSRIAPDFYKFYLTDTVDIEGVRCVELSFAPRNPAAFGFTGRLYVEEGDTTMFVRRVRMNVPPSINLNYIDHLQAMQEFRRAPDGSRLKVLDDFNIEISVSSSLPGIYVHRTTAYDDFSFEPSPRAELLDRLGDTFYDPHVYARDDAFWEKERLDEPTKNEKRLPDLMARLRGVPIYYYGEKFIRLMAQGYVKTGRDSKFDIGPLNTFISGNSIEGARFRVGGMTTANLSKHWFARGYVAYGAKDHRFKYGAELEYSFNEKRYHSREFPVHSLRFTERYDIDQLGQHYLFTNADNVFLALKRQKNLLMTYRRETRLDYELELNNHLSVKAGVNLERQEAGPYVPFRFGDGTSISHYTETLFSLTLRYAPGEKFYQTKSDRIPINLDAPVIILTQTYAPAGKLGSRFGVNKTELSVQKRFWFSAFGFADVILKGGKVWGKAPYISLLIPNANLSYTIQPESFALMTPLEFINDSFASWDLTYWANGAIFNYVPLLKKLKLREVFAFRGWWGKLSDKNNPALNTDLLQLPPDARWTPMGHKPYMEASVGIDNLFKCLRVDYVWRLSYRAAMPAKDRRGIRIQLHITF